MPGLVAIIPCFNEEDVIADALASVAFCDEVFVVDSFSTDSTMDIVKASGARYVQREYAGPAEQKNWAIDQVEADWILFLDADESVPNELQEEIKGIMESTTSKDAYWIGRQNHFMGRRVRFSGWQGDKVIRLFKKGKCRYKPVRVHEEMECTGELGMLKAKLIHHTYKDMPHYLEKFDRYTTWSAYDRSERTSKVTLFHLWVKPTFRFFRHYFLKGGILDGRVGFIISYMSAYSVFLRYLKLDRLQKGEKL
jgi:glycosyltransferase involved in cell wall biosynthesis